jgi:hypothetical protein
LAGNPNVFWISHCGLVVFLAARAPTWAQFRRLVLTMTAALSLAGCLGAVQWLSSAELIMAGNRPLQGLDYATRHGMHFTTWSSLLMPIGGVFRFAPEFNLHIGLPLACGGLVMLLLGAREKNLRALLALAIAGAVLSAGDQSPVLGWLVRWLPGFGAMRYPSRYGVLIAFAVLLAGSIALSRLSVRRPRGGRLAAFLQLALISAAALQLAAFYATPSKGYWDEALRTDLTEHGFFPANGVPPHIAFPPGQVRSNSGLVQGYSTLDGFNSPFLRSVWDSAHRESDTPPPDFDFHQLSPGIYRRGPFPLPSAALVAGWNPQTNTTVFRSAADAPPRAWLTQPEDVSAATAQPLAGGAATIDLTTTSAAPCVLILAEPYYPGWRATCNGRSPCAPSCGAARAGTAPWRQNKLPLSKPHHPPRVERFFSICW